jgi:hypothetical protein
MEKPEMIARITEQNVQILGLLNKVYNLEDQLEKCEISILDLEHLCHQARGMYPEVEAVYISLQTKDRLTK